MEVQPTELLETIFKQFSSLNDLKKCFRTCLRWKKIIQNVADTKNHSKVLVALGASRFTLGYVEILDLLDSNCHEKFMDERLKLIEPERKGRDEHNENEFRFGTIMKNQPIVLTIERFWHLY